MRGRRFVLQGPNAHHIGLAGWEEEYKAWCQRDLSTKRYVYWWADGIYFNVRLDEERSCVLVLIGALEDGTKELLAVVDGYRESTQSWRELLQQLKRQGLSTVPKLAIGDGSLGFWLAFIKSGKEHQSAMSMEQLKSGEIRCRLYSFFPLYRYRSLQNNRR